MRAFLLVTSVIRAFTSAPAANKHFERRNRPILCISGGGIKAGGGFHSEPGGGHQRRHAHCVGYVDTPSVLPATAARLRYLEIPRRANMGVAPVDMISSAKRPEFPPRPADACSTEDWR